MDFSGRYRRTDRLHRAGCVCTHKFTSTQVLPDFVCDSRGTRPPSGRFLPHHHREVGAVGQTRPYCFRWNFHCCCCHHHPRVTNGVAVSSIVSRTRFYLSSSSSSFHLTLKDSPPEFKEVDAPKVQTGGSSCFLSAPAGWRYPGGSRQCTTRTARAGTVSTAASSASSTQQAELRFRQPFPE